MLTCYVTVIISQILENLKIIIELWGNKMKLTTSCNLSALWACLPLSAALYTPLGLVHAVHAALVLFGCLFKEEIKDCYHRGSCGGFSFRVLARSEA